MIKVGLDDSLSILESLSNGVKKKVSAEDSSFDDDIIYVVNTSLKSKNKLNNNLNKDELEESVENLSVYNENIEEFSETDISDVSLDTVIDENKEESVEEINIVQNSNIEEQNVAKRKSKIERNGNVFSRGGKQKKKKEPTVDWKLEREKRNQELLEKKNKEKLSNDTDVELEETDIEKVETVVDEVEGDYNTLIGNTEEVSFDSVVEDDLNFDDFFDDSDNNVFDDDLNDSGLDEKIDKEVVDEFFNKPLNDDEIVKSGIKKSSQNDELKEVDGVEEKEDPFKWCKYYPGMSIEDFLRANKEYRDAYFVEHFYPKDELNKLVNKGLVIFRKGQYRL